MPASGSEATMGESGCRGEGKARMLTAWMRGSTAARRSRRLHAAVGLAALVVAFVPAAAGGMDQADGAPAGAAQSWPVAGQNVANTRDQAAESLISAANVGQLRQKWSLKTAGDVTATPTMMNGVNRKIMKGLKA